MLERAIDAARQEGITVNNARRLHKDLDAQKSALEVGAHLDEVLRTAPCGSGVLKAALSKAERVAATTVGNTSSVTLGTEFLAPRVLAVKRQLDLERAAEALGRMAQGAKSIEALPKLEAAILTAKKLGADELDPESYRCVVMCGDVCDRHVCSGGNAWAATFTNATPGLPATCVRGWRAPPGTGSSWSSPCVSCSAAASPRTPRH